MAWLRMSEVTLCLMEGGKVISTIVGERNPQGTVTFQTEMLMRWLSVPNSGPGSLVLDFDPKDVEPAMEASEKPPGTNEPFPKPSIKWVDGCPNQSARNGGRIRSIVNHYTTSNSINGVISWFRNPKSQVSAHYIIDRAGLIYQMVSDDRKAWHAGNDNTDTIGIEHCAEGTEKLTDAQTKSSVALQRWLMSEYKIPVTRVTAHRFTPAGLGTGTSCPGHIFGADSEAALEAWKAKHLS